MKDKHYFKPKRANDGRVYRERVYCYELYHQLRNLLTDNCPYKLDGEMDKTSHSKFKRKKPDFIVNVPGIMTHNLVVVEMKPITAAMRFERLKKDIEKLEYFVSEGSGSYYRGIMLVYSGDSEKETEKKIEKLKKKFTDYVNSGSEILLMYHPGPEKSIKLIQTTKSVKPPNI